MSYCRWSDMNGYCDVYVYEDVNGGYTCHVAGQRIPSGAPYIGYDLLMASALAGSNSEKSPAWELYQKNKEIRDEWAKDNEPVPIEHELAGSSFNCPTPGEMADHLEKLAREGFIVPGHAVISLREEQRELKD